ncbi:MAG TPA: hypothetical protein VF702_04570 [Allosphingosinicella sp.]
MSTKSFRSVGWVAGVGAAALGCYMLSLQVAAERAELAAVERRIVAARQQIRTLQTELGTRGRLQQLEHWNAEVLALSAPAAGQFVENEIVLARLETRGSGELAAGAPVRMASAETGDGPVAAQPPVRTAAAPAAPAPATPTVRRASLATPAPTPAARPIAAKTQAPVRTAGLDARTTRAIGEAARAEARPTRPPRTAAAATPARTASATTPGTSRPERRPSEAPARTSAKD